MSVVKQQEQQQANQQIIASPIQISDLEKLIYDIDNLDQPTKYKNEELAKNPYIVEQFVKECPKKQNDPQIDQVKPLSKNKNLQQIEHPNGHQNNTPPISPLRKEPQQIEGQKFKTLELQKQQEVQFYVYEDLANFTKVFTDTIETLKHFEDLKNQEYVNTALNRLIAQTNLSNAIHFDCQHTFATNPDQKQFYLQEKKNAQQIFNQLMQQACLIKNEKVQQCLQSYVQNFQEKTNLSQLELLNIKQKPEFNQQTAQAIFDGVKGVDATLAQVNQGKYKKLEKQDISRMLEERKIIAQNKLNQNFPKNENTMKKAEELNKKLDVL